MKRTVRQLLQLKDLLSVFNDGPFKGDFVACCHMIPFYVMLRFGAEVPGPRWRRCVIIGVSARLGRPAGAHQSILQLSLNALDSARETSLQN